MIKYEICIMNKNKVDQYDDEKILFCEKEIIEYYRRN